MTVAVIQFCGSNCDRDTTYVYEEVLKASCKVVWQDESELPPETKAIVIPGGFSFGDYLRAGAMAAHRPIMKAVKRFADAGAPVLGICNGFQILCESRMLPGVLLPNQEGRFICTTVQLEVVGAGKGALRSYASEEVITLPIAHHDGRYYASEEEMKRLHEENKIALKYQDKDQSGNATINGSSAAIAGIFGGINSNVLGLMPHPERRSEMCLGGVDGLRMLQALII